MTDVARQAVRRLIEFAVGRIDANEHKRQIPHARTWRHYEDIANLFDGPRMPTGSAIANASIIDSGRPPASTIRSRMIHAANPPSRASDLRHSDKFTTRGRVAKHR
jgi:hypothetical protein